LIGCSKTITFIEDKVSGKRSYKTPNERVKIPNGIKDGLISGLEVFKESLSGVFYGLVVETNNKFQQEGFSSGVRQFISGTFGVVTIPSKGILKIGANILNSINYNKSKNEKLQKIYKISENQQGKEDYISFLELDGTDEVEEAFEK
jgi:hypothetical protein